MTNREFAMAFACMVFTFAIYAVLKSRITELEEEVKMQGKVLTAQHQLHEDTVTQTSDLLQRLEVMHMEMEEQQHKIDVLYRWYRRECVGTLSKEKLMDDKYVTELCPP